MFLIGDKRLYPAGPVVGAMGKGSTAQSQAVFGKEGGSSSARRIGKVLSFPVFC